MKASESATEMMREKSRTQIVLDLVVDCAHVVSPFNRISAVRFHDPIEPENAASSTTIAEYSTCGLADSELDEIENRIGRGERVLGEYYLEASRMGRCYCFRNTTISPALRVMPPSSKAFLTEDGWLKNAAVVVPFWEGQRVLGHLVLDEPENGVPPCDNCDHLLERLASVVSVALSGTYLLEKLGREHELLSFFAESAMTGLLVVQEGEIRFVNEQLARILGFERQQLETLSPWWNFFHPDDRPAVWETGSEHLENRTRLRAIRRDGRVVWLNTRIQSVLYADGDATAIQMYDVTDRIEAEELLKEKALRDPLTGFRNRGYFDEAIHIELQRSKRYKREFTLIMADLANFKLVNDQFGHQEGDRILAGIANLIQTSLRESDWGVRYGGDEFLLVLPETGSTLDALIARLASTVEAWCASNCRDLPVGIDFGWSTWSHSEPKDVPDLVREADVLLYENKAKRRSRTSHGVASQPPRDDF